ncbi:hypothetical protein [Opitutus sp. ER46]|uniref:hypothetical protein n=1 Tax=Opitutus sp. ER46 TaxID=2161864 RepID=UPI000D2FDFA0|nr:hypothetical protein [Opitutus sp. ER46]PTX92394.1 hypothetical protein DB354_13730 [Opitutus sp. ER46]
MRWLVPLLLCLHVAAAAPAAAPQPDAPPVEARQLYRHLELDQRFPRERAAYLAFMRGNNPTAGENSLISVIGDRLLVSDFETHLATFIATRFTREELEAINGYLATAIGRREYQHMRALERDIAAGTLAPADIDGRRNAFYDALPPADRAASLAFSATDAGRKYWQNLALIDGYAGNVVPALATAIISDLSRGADARPAPAR